MFLRLKSVYMSNKNIIIRFLFPGALSSPVLAPVGVSKLSFAFLFHRTGKLQKERNRRALN